MALFPRPTEAIEQIDKIRTKKGLPLKKAAGRNTNFISSNGRRSHKPKFQGGLGIKNLAIHNKSMMMKWL